MPYLEKDKIFYETLKAKKYNQVKTDILKLYVTNLEKKQYPMDLIYPPY